MMSFRGELPPIVGQTVTAVQSGPNWLTETAIQVVGDLWPESAGLDFENETESLAVLCPAGEQWHSSSCLSLSADSQQSAEPLGWSQDVATSPAPSEISSLSSSPSSIYSPLTEPDTPELKDLKSEPDHLQTLVDDILKQDGAPVKCNGSGPWSASEQLVSSQAAATVKEDEHAQMIDIGLQDLLTLESMCGITSAEAAPSPVQQIKEDEPEYMSFSNHSMGEMANKESKMILPVKEQLFAPPKKVVDNKQKRVTQPVDMIRPEHIKQEPAEDDIEIVQEVTVAKKPARVTPQLCISTSSTSSPTQIVIVLSQQQVENIQKSGQLVLTAEGLSTVVSTSQRQQNTQQSVKPLKQVATVAGRVRPSNAGTAGAVKVTKRSARPTPISTVGRRSRTAAPAVSAAATKEDAVSSWPSPSNAAVRPAWPTTTLLSADDSQTANDSEIPDDLQDLLLEGAAADAALPADADSILEDLMAADAVQQPLFAADDPLTTAAADLTNPGDLTNAADLTSPGGDLAAASPGSDLMGSAYSPCSVASDLLSPLCSPPPQQRSPGSLEPWSPPPEEPWSRRRERSKPYQRSKVGSGKRLPALTEQQRRERKKEQNKNAAIRYRQKKREELESVSCDQQQLEERNRQLRGRVGSLTQELGYLRGLMREVLRHRRTTATH